MVFKRAFLRLATSSADDLQEPMRQRNPAKTLLLLGVEAVYHHLMPL